MGWLGTVLGVAQPQRQLCRLVRNALKCHMKSYFDLVWFAMRIMASTLRSTSSSVVAQQETEMRMAVCPCHTVPPHQQVPSAWIPAITRRVSSGVPNETST